jgi:hypothetical protein
VEERKGSLLDEDSIVFQALNSELAGYIVDERGEKEIMKEKEVKKLVMKGQGGRKEGKKKERWEK